MGGREEEAEEEKSEQEVEDRRTVGLASGFLKEEKKPASSVRYIPNNVLFGRPG